jgi:2-amino-4-hydroxy-6-hydroxymethyldihydropteridine diphosphokinase
MHVRNFVLIPLIEIIPNRQHPVFDKTMEELLAETEDIIVVNKIDKV